jgi:CRP-like cAMP-binding protein
MLGLPGALGAQRMVGEVIQQITGDLARMSISDLRAEIERRGALSQVMERYSVALISAIGQGVVCNRHHPVESRAARWLLATHDRAGVDSFRLTQDFLATMLGVTRPQVTLAAASLRNAGLISYRRGQLQILDRDGLEDASCECYGVLRDEFDRLLGDSNGNPWVPVGG